MKRVVTRVKICGLATPGAVAAALEVGVDALGFVFAESPRRVGPAQAAALCRDVPTGVLRVAVMRHPTQMEVDAVIDGFRPDCLQTDAADFADLNLPDTLARWPVWRDVPALDEAALVRDGRVLFEAAASGQGQRADWQRAARLAQRVELILAGGLDPDNVGAAIACVRPWGVDVSSGVESRRGVKDLGRIAAFVAAVRRMEQDHAG